MARSAPAAVGVAEREPDVACGAQHHQVGGLRATVAEQRTAVEAAAVDQHQGTVVAHAAQVHQAQAGGTEPDKLPAALAGVNDWVAAKL